MDYPTDFAVTVDNPNLDKACCLAYPAPSPYMCPPSPRPTARPSGHPTPASPQRTALVALYASTGGPAWHRKKHWLEPRDPCDDPTWYGVTCGVAGGAGGGAGGTLGITQLQLHANSLRGSLPPELGLLTALTSHLWLYGNLMRGTVPTALGRLTALREQLFLWGNSFTG